MPCTCTWSGRTWHVTFGPCFCTVQARSGVSAGVVLTKDGRFPCHTSKKARTVDLCAKVIVYAATGRGKCCERTQHACLQCSLAFCSLQLDCMQVLSIRLVSYSFVMATKVSSLSSGRCCRADNHTCMLAGADAAFNVFADGERWLEAVHLGVTCLATSSSQPSLLLVCRLSDLSLSFHSNGHGICRFCFSCQSSLHLPAYRVSCCMHQLVST